jgi:hypothetical protein
MHGVAIFATALSGNSTENSVAPKKSKLNDSVGRPVSGDRKQKFRFNDPLTRARDHYALLLIVICKYNVTPLRRFRVPRQKNVDTSNACPYQ